MRIMFVCALAGCALALIDHDFSEAAWAGFMAMGSFYAIRNEEEAKSLDEKHE